MSNVPKLRFSEFNGEWTTSKFGDVFNFLITNSLSRDSLHYEKYGVFNIHYGDIHTKFKTAFYLDRESVPTITPDVDLEKIRSENYCRVGDVILADASEDYADIGKAIEIIDLGGQKLLAGLHTVLARQQSAHLALGYAGRLLQSWKSRKQLMVVAQGAKVLGLSKQYLAGVAIDFPTKEEQQKISDFLTAVDTKIEQLTRKEELLKQYKKGVMQNIFSQQIRFKADDGSDFSEWGLYTVGDLITSNGGTALESLVKVNGSHKFISIGNYSTDGIYIDNGQRIDPEGKAEKKVLNKNDLVMVLNDKTTSGDLIGSSILVDADNTYIYNQRSERIICTNLLLPKYAWFVFNSPKFRQQIVSLAQGGTQIYINFPSVKSISIELPSIEEQRKITLALSSINKKIDQITDILVAARTFKKGLLQQMFV